MNNPMLEQLNRLDALLRRYYGQGWHHGSSPHRGQGRILTMLKLQPDISQRELSFLLDISKQSLGEMLAKLEAKGYITRRPSEEDRRVQKVRLTEAGAQAADRMGGGELERRDIFTVLSEDEQAQLAGYLGRLIKSLEAEMPKHGGHSHAPKAWDHRECGHHRDDADNQ